MQKILNTNQTSMGWRNLIDCIANDIKGLLNWNNKNNLELFFAPSGTDLVYYPLLISKLIHPDKKILNITTCIEELGSGTRLATAGKYYANYNQFGEKKKKGSSILPKEDMENYYFKARSESGDIMNNQEAIIELVKRHPNHSTIINLVYGSKSGIEDSLSLIDKIEGDNILWNTDLCQFRHSKDIINKLIDKNSMVMITGSKFYQSPPFCAAMLVPKKIYSKLLKSNSYDQVRAFSSIFSSYDFPNKIRKQLNYRQKINIASILRWSCALEEIKKYNDLPIGKVEEKINAWRKTVSKLLEEKDEFQLMPFQENTNKTIISFRIKLNNTFLDENALKKLHQLVVSLQHEELPSSRRFFIGQPVTYFANKSFLRLAIGAINIRKFVEDDEYEFNIDKKIIEILILSLKKFNENL
jgi:hypothetical protein